VSRGTSGEAAGQLGEEKVGVTAGIVTVLVKPNVMKKKAPPDRTPIKPNKGSALPSKGKQKPGANQVESTN